MNYYSGKIIIGEGGREDGFENYNYYRLQDDYDVDFLDLNRDEFIEVEGVDSQLNSLKFRLSRTVIDSDYRISVAVAKTHNCVITTLSTKNIVVGSLVNNDQKKFQGLS